MVFPTLDVDSLLQALSFMSAHGLAMVACTSRLGAVIAHEAQQRPTLVVLKGTLADVGRKLCHRIAARPTVAFLQFMSPSGPGDADRGREMLRFVHARLPPETEVLGAQTDSLLCALRPEGNTAATGTVIEVSGVGDDEGAEQIGLLLATFPEAKAHAFHVKVGRRTPHIAAGSSSSEEDDDSSFDEAGEEREAEEEEECAEEGEQTNANTNSLHVDVDPPTAPASAEDAKVDLMTKLLALDPPPEVIVIHLASRATRIVDILQRTYPRAAIIGGCVMGEQVLARPGRSRFLTGPTGVPEPDRASVGFGVGVLAICGNAPLFAMTCPFTGTAKAAGQHVRAKMRLTQDLASAEEQQILGALLCTCNARGSRMFKCDGFDARMFQAQFPKAPLLGHYAGGEIGPEVAGDDEVDGRTAFLRGNAAVQGFTAVFGLFLVPRKHIASVAFQRAVLHGEVEAAFREQSLSGDSLT